MNFTSKSGKEALAVHHSGESLSITEQTTNLEQIKLFWLPFHNPTVSEGQEVPQLALGTRTHLQEQ